MFPGRISATPLRAAAVRFAWAIKPTIRWPLSNQEKDGVTVSRLNAKNVATNVAVNGASEIGVKSSCRVNWVTGTMSSIKQTSIPAYTPITKVVTQFSRRCKSIPGDPASRGIRTSCGVARIEMRVIGGHHDMFHSEELPQ